MRYNQIVSDGGSKLESTGPGRIIKSKGTAVPLRHNTLARYAKKPEGSSRFTEEPRMEM